MKTLCFYLLLCGVVIFATGCPKYRPTVDFNNKDSFQGKLNVHLAAEQKRYQCYRDGKNYSDTNPPTCTGSVPDGPARAKAVRNELIADALSYIDDAYGDFKNDLTAGRDRNNFVADLIELGASAAVGITNGERPLQILGIGLTAFRGGRRSADVNFYRDQSTPILISKMNGQRASVRTAILENEKKEIDIYPIGAAISDIVDYYNAGTLVDAFTKLSEDTAVQTSQTEARLRTLKAQAGIAPAPTEEELRVSRANAGAIDALADAYTAAAEKVLDAQDDVDEATRRSNNATQRIADATQKIADAQAIINAENAKTNPSQAVITQATANRTTAEADKTKAEADKTKAEADKTQAETARTAATTARDTAFANLKGVYDAIEADPALSPLLDKIPDSDPRFSATFKARLQTTLQRLKEKKPASTPAEKQQRVEDYVQIMLLLGRVVRTNLSRDPTLNQRLQTILKVNQ
jgi:hypothetical protein